MLKPKKIHLLRACQLVSLVWLLVALFFVALHPVAVRAMSPPALQQTITMIGEAVDTKSGQLVYREYHSRDEPSALHAVSYRSASGEPFVEKIIDTSRRAIAPDFHQQDYRDGTVIAATTRGEQVTLVRGTAAAEDGRSVFAMYKEQPLALDANTLPLAAIESKHQLVATPDLVIDAGFDYFVRENWSALLAGKVMEFDFMVPARGRTVTMSLAKTGGEQCARERASNPEIAKALGASPAYTCFRLTVNNWFAKVFLKPILLVYDDQSMRLMAFRGLSNLKNDAGEAQSVLITYRYL